MHKVTYFLIISLFLGCKSPTNTNTSPPPNIIFILADDLGYGEVGCFGQEKIQTPHIDSLAARGMKLTEHYSGSPVCASARCTFITGLHTGHAYVRNNQEVGGWGPDEPEGQIPLLQNTNTVSKSLQELGYTTGAFGKWGLGGPESTGHPNVQGFDRFYGYLCQRVAHNYYPTHLWDNTEKEMLEGNEEWFSAHQKLEEAPSSYDQYAAETYAPDRIIDEAVEFINDNSSQPFFLYFASIIPHLALQIPDEEVNQYPRDWDTGPYLGNKMYLPHERPRAAYAAMISRFDQEVGNLVDALEKNGIADNTLIVVTSDNGPSWVGGVDMEFFNSQADLRGRKAQLWEGGIKVPTVVCWPNNIKSSTTNDTPTAFWDWYPTFVSLAGGEIIESDGENLVPLFGQEGTLPNRGLYWEFGNSQAFRNGPWKLLQFKTRAGIDTHLYHLGDDPSESINLAAQLPQQVELLIRQSRAMRSPSSEFPSFLD